MKVKIHGVRFRIAAVFVGILFLVLLVETLYLAPLNRKNHFEEAKVSQVELAEQIAAGFDFSFRNAIRELEAIAKLPEIVSMEKEKLDETISHVNQVTQFFNYYFVLDRDGRWISYPSQPSMVGKGIPERNMRWVRRTFDENRTVFLDVVVSRLYTLVSGFSTPVRNENGEAVGLLRGVIVTSEKNTVLSTILNTRVGRSGYAYVVSANGWLIAHPRVELDVKDFTVYDYWKYAPVERGLRGEKGIMEYEYDGVTWVAAYHPIESTGWGVVVQQPKADIMEFAKREKTIRMTIFLIAFMVGALILTTILNYTLKPLSGLVESIKSRRFKEGETFSRDEIGQIAGEFHSLYSELSRSQEDLREHRDHLEELVAERTNRLSRINEKLEREITVRQKADEKLRAALAEKDLLIREVHHRVRNNMQLISSLLNLQAGYVEDGKYAEMFRESQNRIKSMSIVQEKVFESNDLSNIDFEDSIKALAKGLYRSYSTDTNRISLKTDVRDVSMSIDTAIPCALIINELMSNCLRHAFPGGRKGGITVSLVRAEKGEFELTVADDGVGVPEGMDLENASSLGFQIVTTIAQEQLHGKVDYTSDGGLKVRVGFREIEYRARI